MNRIWLAPLVLVPLMFAAAATACSSDPPAVQDAGATNDTGPQPDTGVSTLDSGSDGSITCTFAAPNFNGPAPCGAQLLLAPVGAMKADGGGDTDGGYYKGGAVQPGIYDVDYFQSSIAAASVSEVIVFGADGKFTRSRQLSTGIGTAPNSYRSGTYTVSGNSIKLIADCYYLGDAAAEAGLEAGNGSLLFNVQQTGCTSNLEYGATGVSVRLKRRN